MEQDRERTVVIAASGQIGIGTVRGDERRAVGGLGERHAVDLVRAVDLFDAVAEAVVAVGVLDAVRVLGGGQLYDPGLVERHAGVARIDGIVSRLREGEALGVRRGDAEREAAAGGGVQVRALLRSGARGDLRVIGPGQALIAQRDRVVEVVGRAIDRRGDGHPRRNADRVADLSAGARSVLARAGERHGVNAGGGRVELLARPPRRGAGGVTAGDSRPVLAVGAREADRHALTDRVHAAALHAGDRLGRQSRDRVRHRFRGAPAEVARGHGEVVLADRGRVERAVGYVMALVIDAGPSCNAPERRVLNGVQADDPSGVRI